MRVCKVDGCSEEHYAKDYCNKHYMQMRNYGKVRPDRIVTAECTVVGCDRVHSAKGYCNMHYQRMRKHGTSMP